MLRRWIRWLHLVVGLAVSVLMFVFALTGAALVYKEAYWRLVYPELRGTTQLTAADHAAAVAAAEREFGDEIRNIKLPEPGVNAYHLYLADGEAFLATDDYRVIDRWKPSQRAMAFLFDVHAHLTAGDVGERIGGVVGLFGVFLAVTGIYLWWPTRRRFSLRGSILPRGIARHHLIAWHRDMGLIWSPALLVLLLTAGGLVFYETAGRVLSLVMSNGSPAAGAAPPTTTSHVALTPALFTRASSVFPDARVVFYYPPAKDAPVHRFRMRRSCELHSNGRTFVTVDGAGEVLEAADACAMGASTRAQHAFYPLHSGKAMGGVYKLLILLASLVLAVLAASGVLAYARKLFRLDAREKRSDITAFKSSSPSRG